MPAFSSTADSAVVCSLGGEHRAAHQPLQVGALGDHRFETVEIGFHGVEGVLFERQFEQGGGIASSHARYHRFVACHVVCSSGQFRRLGAPRSGRRKPLKLKWDFEFPEGVARATEPHENRAFC